MTQHRVGIRVFPNFWTMILAMDLFISQFNILDVPDVTKIGDRWMKARDLQ